MGSAGTTTSAGSSGANAAAGAANGGAGNVAGSAVALSGAGGAAAGGTNVGGSTLGGNAGVSGSFSGGSAGIGGGATCTPGTGTTDIDGDTVLDNHTCLTWQKTIHAGGPNLYWAAENQYCQDLTQAGFDDWRMPTLEELASWPVVGPAGGNIMTAPRYVGANWTDEQKNGDFHVCMRTFYQAGCGWQGSQNVYGTVCVRGQGQNLTPFDKVCDNTCTTHLAAYGCMGADCFVPWQ